MQDKHYIRTKRCNKFCVNILNGSKGTTVYCKYVRGNPPLPVAGVRRPNSVAG